MRIPVGLEMYEDTRKFSATFPLRILYGSLSMVAQHRRRDIAAARRSPFRFVRNPATNVAGIAGIVGIAGIAGIRRRDAFRFPSSLTSFDSVVWDISHRGEGSRTVVHFTTEESFGFNGNGRFFPSPFPSTDRKSRRSSIISNTGTGRRCGTPPDARVCGTMSTSIEMRRRIHNHVAVSRLVCPYY